MFKILINILVILQDHDCMKCSRSFFNDVLFNQSFNYHFTNVYVGSSKFSGFSPSIQNLVSKYGVSKIKLVILCSNSSYIDLIKSKENRCMFFQSCNNPPAVFVVFTEILTRILRNHFIELFHCLEESNMSDTYSNKVMMTWIKDASMQCIFNTFNAFCKNV